MERRRPTLEELRELPVIIWRMECFEFAVQVGDLAPEIASNGVTLSGDPDITPEKVIALWETFPTKKVISNDSIQITESANLEVVSNDPA